MKFFSKIKNSLKKTRKNFKESVSNLTKNFSSINEEFLLELEEALIMADVGTLTAKDICNDLKVLSKKEKTKTLDQLKDSLRKVIANILGENEVLDLSTCPSIILVVGVNGVGKTTSIGKLANFLKNKGHSVIVGAADTFRAAAIEQLEIWCNRVDVPIIKQKGSSDPAAVVFDTISAAKARNKDVIICDTAGRLHNKENLMRELLKILRVAKRELPTASFEILLVLDATVGQNAISQAKEFKNILDLTGIILTKLDGTSKGGIILAIKKELSISVKFIGLGEGLEDFSEFSAKDFSENIISF